MKEVLRAKWEFWKALGVYLLVCRGSGEKDLQFGTNGGSKLLNWMVRGS
jgi:hypothetical protein